MLVGESKFPYSTFVQDADTYPHVRSPYVLLLVFPCHPIRTVGQFNRYFSYAVHQRQVNMRLFVVSFIVALIAALMPNVLSSPFKQWQARKVVESAVANVTETFNGTAVPGGIVNAKYVFHTRAHTPPSKQLTEFHPQHA